MDGDHYHKSLSRRYQQIYKQVGQGHFSPEELAYNTLRPLLKDVRGYGDEVVQFLDLAAQAIEREMALPLLRQLTDRDTLKSEIERLAQTVQADVRGKNLAQNVCERYLNELDPTAAATNVCEALAVGYLMEIYTANFEALARMSPGTTKYGLSHEDVLAQLPQMRPYVEAYATHIAEQLARSISVDNVKRPSAPRADEVVELEEIIGL